MFRRERLAFPGVQNKLFVRRVSEYGSEKEAARWAATEETFPHVSGDAVDIGPSDATAWLSETAPNNGRARSRATNPDYELRPGAIDHGCPPMYGDRTHDPVNQQ